MSYKVRLTHINPDYSVDPLPETPWTVDVLEDDEMILLLNRVAITSSQYPMEDCPELEIRTGGKRSMVTALNGQLYFSEPLSPNRQNLKVVPVEILRLLRNEPLDVVFQDEPEESPSGSVRYRASAGNSSFYKMVLWLILLSVIAVSGRIVWRELTYRPSMVDKPAFIAEESGATESLREYTGIYVSEYREGGLVIRLSQEGKFDYYEMWLSQESERFVLTPTESLSVQVGFQAGRPALLAGDFYLMLPQVDGSLVMHRTVYHRHDGTLKEIGEILSAGR